MLMGDSLILISLILLILLGWQNSQAKLQRHVARREKLVFFKNERLRLAQSKVSGDPLF